MTNNFKKAWNQYATPLERNDLSWDRPEDILVSINFMRGVILGMASQMDDVYAQVAELDEKLRLSFAYQREVDARIAEQYTFNGKTIAADIRDTRKE